MPQQYSNCRNTYAALPGSHSVCMSVCPVPASIYFQNKLYPAAIRKPPPRSTHDDWTSDETFLGILIIWSQQGPTRVIRHPHRGMQCTALPVGRRIVGGAHLSSEVNACKKTTDRRTDRRTDSRTSPSHIATPYYLIVGSGLTIGQLSPGNWNRHCSRRKPLHSWMPECLFLILCK